MTGTRWTAGCLAGAWALAAGLVAFAATSARADSPDYRTGPPPAWVEVLEPDLAAPTPAGQANDGTYFVLFDRQVKVHTRGHAEYTHLALRLTNPEGVESQSQLSLYFDPTYQQLTLHDVKLRRGDETIDLYGRARVTVLPVEQDLQARVYDGTRSVNLLLPDLRVGDVLEYAYTIEGTSPLFPDHYRRRMDIGWSDPVRMQRIRLLHTIDRPLGYRVDGATAEPSIREFGGNRELGFVWHDLPAKQGESDLPGWYTHWPYLEVSDLQDWREVERLLAPLYRVGQDGVQFRQWVDALASVEGGPAAQVVAALRRVQAEIAYTSIAIGEGSHRPTEPELVLQRRFGDCKDKSVLLAALLRELGIDARVAFVHTSRGRALPEALPSPFAFNHAIVRVELEGQVYWLDPTRNWQGGTLAILAQPDFQYALPLGGEGLEAMPRRPADGSSRHVQMIFDLRDGTDKPARLEVVTTLRGEAADAARRDLAARESRTRVADYVNYYARLYPGLEADGEHEVADDLEGNVVRMTERYRLPSGFRPDASGVDVFEILPDELYDLASQPETPVRTAPIALWYPNAVSQVFEVRLPEPWPVVDSRTPIDNGAFRYSSTASARGNTVVLEYQYQALADHVAAADVAVYLDDLRRMSDDLGFELTYHPSPLSQLSAGVAAGPALLVLASLGLAVWLALRVYRYDPPPRQPPAPPEAPVGIRGWLLLPALSLIIIIGTLVVFAGSFAMHLSAGAWSSLPEKVPAAWSGLARSTLLGLVVVAVWLASLAVSTAIAFFKRRTSAVRLWIMLAWTTAIFGVVAGWLVAQLFGETRQEEIERVTGVVRDVASTALWTVYMLKSKRVRATFTQRLARRPKGALMPETA